MPSLALWAMFLTTSAWVVSTSTTGGGGAFPYGQKQLTSVGVFASVIDVPRL